MMRLVLRSLLPLLLLAAAPAVPARGQYGLDYMVRFEPASGEAAVTIATEPGDGRLIALDMHMPADRYSALDGDGRIERSGERVLWTVPDDGGEFRFRYRIDHRRRAGYDARITDDWVIVRGDDLIPSARVRATKGADSRARLRFELPEGWSNVDTPYVHAKDKRAFVVVNPERRYDRPVGWIIAGEVGTRREVIEGMEVSVAAPKGESYPRLEILGYINAAAPELKRLAGELPSKLLIVGAGDPMWRGGLSGPRSLWLHADRPLISENGTSSLYHELFHSLTRIRDSGDADWITEGLAEYYSIELLYRAGLLSEARRDKALGWMANHGRKVKTLRAKRSAGPRTARAVTLFAALDREIRARTDSARSLDDVVVRLVELRVVSVPELEDVVEKLIGGSSRTLDTPLLR